MSTKISNGLYPAFIRVVCNACGREMIPEKQRCRSFDFRCPPCQGSISIHVHHGDRKRERSRE